nr:hypothetical protein [Tanacetum cinerariifolium]
GSFINTAMFRWRGSTQKQEQQHHEKQPEDKLSELKAALGPLDGRNLLYC